MSMLFIIEYVNISLKYLFWRDDQLSKYINCFRFSRRQHAYTLDVKERRFIDFLCTIQQFKIRNRQIDFS